MKLKAALIGYGYWGEILLRNILSHEDFEVCMVADLNSDNIAKLREGHPQIKGTLDLNTVFKNQEIEVVFVSTQATSHYKIVKEALYSNKHVLVEKPMTCSFIEALDLHQIANKMNLVLMVDHILMYSEAVHAIKKIVSSHSDILLSVSCDRMNNGRITADVDVIWDLAPHDISVINYILEEFPIKVELTKSTTINDKIQECFVLMTYQNSKTVQLAMSWICNPKKRGMVFRYQNSRLIYDEALSNDKKIRLEIDSADSTTTYETIYIPLKNVVLPLNNVLRDFAKSVNTNSQPLSDSARALDIISIIESVYLSAATNSEVNTSYFSRISSTSEMNIESVGL